MANPVMGLAADGGDIRMRKDDRNPSVTPGIATRPQHRLLHDPAVTFEEYHYYALKTRAEEDALAKNDTGKRSCWMSSCSCYTKAENEIADMYEGTTTIKSIIFPPKSTIPMESASGTSSPPTDEKGANFSREDARIEITDVEWTNANRAFRTATWAACFYLITTDILGPFGVG